MKMIKDESLQSARKKFFTSAPAEDAPSRKVSTSMAVLPFFRGLPTNPITFIIVLPVRISTNNTE